MSERVENLSPTEIRARSAVWYERQRDTISKCLGKRWPVHQEWIEQYLREELRQRLLQLGWRPKR